MANFVSNSSFCRAFKQNKQRYKDNFVFCHSLKKYNNWKQQGVKS